MYKIYLLFSFLQYIITSDEFNSTGITKINRIEWIKKWNSWWHYKNGEIGGPQHWGHTLLMSKYSSKWKVCRLGRNQSPINVPLHNLLYDPLLQPLVIQGAKQSIHVMIENMGQDLTFNQISNELITFMKGPLVYSYRFFSFLLKFGSTSLRGSDHHINNKSFSGEIQLYAYNHELYSNLTEAINKPQGLAAISVLFKIGETSSEDLKALVNGAEKCSTKGAQHDLEGIKLHRMLPSTDQFITYPGSLPLPPCDETVTWILLNEQINITESQLKTLRDLRLYKSSHSGRMSDNFRPVQTLNNRIIRTNVNYLDNNPSCRIQQQVSYTMNLN